MTLIDPQRTTPGWRVETRRLVRIFPFVGLACYIPTVVLFGRGIGRNEQQRVFGIQIEPEKEIVLTLVPTDMKDAMIQEIVRVAELTMPGNGLAFIVPVETVAGIVHLVEERPS